MKADWPSDAHAWICYFDVIGHPMPQGSKRFVGNGRSIEAGGQAFHQWRRNVAERAREIADGIEDPTPLDGALHIDIDFRFPMPTGRPKKTRDLGHAHKSTTPDIDKLIRSVADGLVDGGLLVDDARIASVYATKLEIVGWSGARIKVTRL